MTLASLAPGDIATILSVGGNNRAARMRLMELGLMPGTLIKMYRISETYDLLALQIRGFELVIRLEDAWHIEVDQLNKMQVY